MTKNSVTVLKQRRTDSLEWGILTAAAGQILNKLKAPFDV
jgi:hypothetical protein